LAGRQGLFAELGLALVGESAGPWLIPFLGSLKLAIYISLSSCGADCPWGRAEKLD